MEKTMLAALCGGALMLGACAPMQVLPGAEKVRITNQEPAKGDCEFLGDVTGGQGNFFTGKYTSNANLETGARNDIKNKAFQMGGNLVVMLTNRAGETGSAGRYGANISQTNVVMTGSVYKCK